MSSNGEFSTMSSGDVTSSNPKSLPSSREATAEGDSSSQSSYVPLREFLERYSLPRVVRLNGNGGKPVLLYRQQQRSLRVSTTLLIHRYVTTSESGRKSSFPKDIRVRIVTFNKLSTQFPGFTCFWQFFLSKT